MSDEEQVLKELKELKERRERRGKEDSTNELRPHRSGYGEGRGHRRGRRDDLSPGAKTFRRKRATSFLEQLETKRDSLKKQLETPELQSINQLLVGELKATESIISEFIQSFELHEYIADNSLDSPESETTTQKDQ